MLNLTRAVAPDSLTLTKSAEYFPALTGVRAVAVYMVCLYHFNPFAPYKASEGWQKLAFIFLNQWHIGVTIFFVLSGFLICYRYYEAAMPFTRQWFCRYLSNRVARIYPLYFLLTLLTFVHFELQPDAEHYPYIYASSSGMPATAQRLWIVFLNLTFAKAFFDHYKFTGILQSWSLTVEECFYVSGPFYFLWLRRGPLAWVLLPIATLLLMVGLWAILGQPEFPGLFGSLNFMLNATFFGRCLEFFAGMGLAVYLLRQRRRIRAAQNRRGSWVTIAGCIFLVACLLAMAGIGGVDNAKQCFVGIILNNAVVPVATVMLFYGLLTERTWLRCLLTTKLFDILGKSSYALYLIHLGIINNLLRTYVLQNAALKFFLLNVIAVLLYKYVESPLRIWLKPR